MPDLIQVCLVFACFYRFRYISLEYKKMPDVKQILQIASKSLFKYLFALERITPVALFRSRS